MYLLSNFSPVSSLGSKNGYLYDRNVKKKDLYIYCDTKSEFILSNAIRPSVVHLMTRKVKKREALFPQFPRNNNAPFLYNTRMFVILSLSNVFSSVIFQKEG